MIGCLLSFKHLTNISRLSYHPVAFTFSFTSKELQNDPLTPLRQRFESIDVKLLVEYAIDHTTHVVSKKRNTAKGLQALINGKHIVNEAYLDAIATVSEPRLLENGAQGCPLEEDFDKHWPDPAAYLPARGAEPINHPDSIYAPDSGRREIFEGYSFVFYDSNQYNNLMAPITNGGGKALLEHIAAGETTVDDFVRRVKFIAGEKGLGKFDDGSEGRGVVLVRYLPAKGDHVQWFADFFTQMSLRLDHRPIEQNEFLEAILIKDASMLRRPLEVEEEEEVAAGDENQPPASSSQAASQTPASEDASSTTAPTARRIHRRGPIKRRFAGFDEDVDISMDDTAILAAAPTLGGQAEDGLFVSQEVQHDEPIQEELETSPKKRNATALEEDDLMEDVAPAAARLKRQRIARGETLEPAAPEVVTKPAAKAAPKKKKKELDVLAAAAKLREEQEALARAEQEDLAHLPADIDLAEIRRLNIVEELELRPSAQATRTREQDIADGRWDPKWNGIKNFKKFRRRGEVTGRPPARTIIAVEEAVAKEFGVGDGYWLEDEGREDQSRHNSVSQNSNRAPLQDLTVSAERPLPPTEPITIPATVDDEDLILAEDSQPPRSGRSARSRVTQTQSQGSKVSDISSGRHSQRQATAKRPAPDSSSSTQTSKRPKTVPKFMQSQDSDDSDDELKFRFGRRR